MPGMSIAPNWVPLNDTIPLASSSMGVSGFESNFSPAETTTKGKKMKILLKA